MEEGTVITDSFLQKSILWT